MSTFALIPLKTKKYVFGDGYHTVQRWEVRDPTKKSVLGTVLHTTFNNGIGVYEVSLQKTMRPLVINHVIQRYPSLDVAAQAVVDARQQCSKGRLSNGSV